MSYPSAVPNLAFQDATLVIAAHGTAQNEGSARPALLHAGELRRRGCFGAVHAGFWKQAPYLPEVLERATTPRVFIVPLFISEGYFAEQAIPEALGFRPAGEKEWERMLRVPGRRIHYTRPVGTHDAMTHVVLARASQVIATHPFPRPPHPSDTTLLIAGHGTGRDPNSRRSVERQASMIREAGIYADARAVFMEEEPRIAGCVASLLTRNAVVVPFFISDGLHVTEDIPVLLGEPAAVVRERHAAGLPPWRNPTARQGRMVWYSEAVGTAPEVADVILERVQEAAAG
jgi:sirohydrochlorin cobaltochelatase